MTYAYDPGRSEGLHLITKGPLAFNFWIMEMLLGMIVPMILLLYKPTRMNRFWRMIALLLVATGVVAFRWDTNIAGFMVVMPYIPGQAIAYTELYAFPDRDHDGRGDHRLWSHRLLARCEIFDEWSIIALWKLNTRQLKWKQRNMW